MPPNSIATIIAVVGLIATSLPLAAEPHVADMQVVSSDATAQFVVLGISKSFVIDLQNDIKDVLIADPKIVNVVVRSNRRAYIIGLVQGQSNVYFFGGDGRQIGGLDVFVGQGSPPAALENYASPANVVVVFRGSAGWRYSCNPITCVSGAEAANNTLYIEQTVTTK